MTVHDTSRLLVFTGGALPTGGVSPATHAADVAALEASIDDEAAARATAISAEATARATAVSAEATARQSADNLGDTIRLGSVAGTAQAITATIPVAQRHIALNFGQPLSWFSAAANTGANPTLAVHDGTAATTFTIKSAGGGDLAAGELPGGRHVGAVVQSLDPPVVRLTAAASRISDISGLQGALDAKQPAGSYATAAQGAKADTALQPGSVPDYAPIGGRVADTPGVAHRVTREGWVVATVQSPLGPCDVRVNAWGIGQALTTLPYELLSMSGQSNMLDGGDSLATNAVLKMVRDYRCWREDSHLTWGDGVGSAEVYVDGDITTLRRAGFDTEFTWSGQFTADAISFANVLIDQDMLRQQRVYVQMVSTKGGTPLSAYLPEQALGANITGYIDGTEDYLATLDIDTVMYAHFLVGHEDPTHTGFASYAALLAAFADHVCGEGAALAYNVAHGIRPRVLAYQPNDQIGAADGRTISASAIGTLHCALSDPDVVCIGPVYHERTTDAGLHMIGKLMTAELYAHVYDIVRAGGDFVPLHISAASRVGNVITATLTGPAGFVMRDTDWLPLLATDGITFGDDSNSAFVTGVSFTNANAVTRTLTITLSTVPTGANKRLYIGGRNNAANPGRPGGMCSFYVPGRRSRWVAAGFGDWALPEIRHYLCRDIITII